MQACVANEAVPVIELRQRNYPMAAYLTLYATISKYIRLNDCVLMSFGLDVVKALRAHLPTANIWWITYNLNDDVLNTCKQYRFFDVDVIQSAEDLTAERVQIFHSNGIEVNTWTLYQKKIINVYWIVTLIILQQRSMILIYDIKAYSNEYAFLFKELSHD